MKKFSITLLLLIFISVLSYSQCSTNSSCAACPLNKKAKKTEKIESQSQKSTDKTNSDEFTAAGEEFKSAGDEFKSTDEFKSSDEFKKDTLLENNLANKTEKVEQKNSLSRFIPIDVAILFILIIIISYLIQYPIFRKTRIIFLLGTTLYLGFYKGACPCMISSFENTILIFFNDNVKLVSLVWFLGLIPLTYFFGKIWCGWLCHLGGLQEFIFSFSKFDVLKTRNSQKILKIIQIASFILLVCQLIITKTLIFCEYDPFKVAFNLFSDTTLGYVLLAIMLLSSVFIHRAFCRAFCPVGFVLGLVSLIPFAKRVRKTDSCINCVSCSRECNQKAMIYQDKTTSLDVENCIACGECFGSCKKDSIKFTRK